MTATVPPYTELLWPALQAVIGLGGSASIAEMEAAVLDREQFSPEVLDVLHGEGPSTDSVPVGVGTDLPQRRGLADEQPARRVVSYRARSVSSRGAEFSLRLSIATTNLIGAIAKRTIKAQEKQASPTAAPNRLVILPTKVNGRKLVRHNQSRAVLPTDLADTTRG